MIERVRLMAMQRSRRDFLQQTFVLLAASGAVLENAWGAEPRAVVADTSFGKIRGTDVEGIKIFKGVPYGATTAGKNRFMPPADPAKWTGVREALEFGPSAPQTETG